jgi:ribulose bisphosphate carboxylase small subunit
MTDMNEQIKQLLDQSTYDVLGVKQVDQKQFAELIMQDMHRKVIASILITDVVMEEKGLTPTSEDYIRAINKDFGVE